MDSRYWIPVSWAELWIPKSKILDSKILQSIKVVAFFSDIENYQSNNDPLLNVKIFFSAKKKDFVT